MKMISGYFCVVYVHCVYVRLSFYMPLNKNLHFLNSLPKFTFLFYSICCLQTAVFCPLLNCRNTMDNDGILGLAQPLLKRNLNKCTR